MQDSANQQSWKDQYRDLLGELESKEHQWSELEASLRRAGSQLALAALGRSEDLDASVNALQSLVRDGTDNNQITRCVAALKEVLRTFDDSGDTAEVPDEVQPLISHLVQRISDIPFLTDPAADLVRRLAAGDKQWEGILSDLADGVAQVVSSVAAEKKDLEEFLEQVTEQLADFDTWTEWQKQAAENRRKDTYELDSNVQEQMQELRDEVQTSGDVAVLKLKVQMRLDTVAEKFKSFLAVEERRYAEAEEQNDRLESEVAELRKTTQALAQRCGQQQNRLMIDALTEVHSRYAYDQRLNEEYQRWRRHGNPLAFSIWDIDKFKSVNDALGHNAGDRLLQLMGRIMNREKRNEDFLARIGGEEFVLLLPNTNAESAIAIADRLRTVISDSPFHYRGNPEQVTISCGVTEFHNEDTPLTVYRRADQGLYKAKQAGRNRCVLI